MGVSFTDGLAGHGGRTALVDGDVVVPYADLASRVAATARRLGPVRRLVLVEGSNTLDSVVTYLAALAGGHAVLLAPAAAVAPLTQAWDPDVVAAPSAGGEWLLDERRPGTAHDLHPDLALLLSTSGSTGSPRLVRLSAAAVSANAESVAASLGITPDDVGVTALPLSYCYGLSVLHSHLLRGAAVVLTDLSVVAPCFWDLVRTHGVTSLPGVPHTFDLLDRVGFADLELPSLRLVTQAGGRMDPENVLRWARLGRRRGFDLVVMYGQTEATARMAYLPPDLALTRPECVGVAVPGGELAVEDGEVVYRGPNVMLGYASVRSDLALGRTVTELRTGDLGRLTEDGLLEITGRARGFVKLFGLRVDLERVDALLARQGVVACATGDDTGLRVAVEGAEHPGLLRSWLAAELRLPPRCLDVVPVAAVPRTASGKADRRATAALLTALPAAAPAAGAVAAQPGTAGGPGGTADTADVDGVRRILAETLGVDDVAADESFVARGGDSLSYVSASVRLESALGTLPAGWHLLTAAELAARADTPGQDRGPRRRDRWAAVETGVALRGAAIVAVVGTHSNLFTLRGGAHLLLGVAGYNLARFGLREPTARARVARMLRSTARIALPSMAWIAAVTLVTGLYRPGTALLLNAATGPDTWGPDWHYWYVEALVQILLAVTALAALPVVARLHRAAPFALAASLAAAGLLARFGVVTVDTGPERGTAQYVFWIVALGWCAAVATRPWQRLAVTAAVLAAAPGFFDADVVRDAVLTLGLLALVWLPTVRLPRAAVPVLATLAGASLTVYLTQWQVFPLLRDTSPLLATLASLAVGVALHTCAGRLARAVKARTRRPAAVGQVVRQAVRDKGAQAPIVAASMTNR